jgi:hypothetical protein
MCALRCTAGGDGDFLPTSEAAQTSVLDVIVNGLLNPKERCAAATLQLWV